VIIWFPLASADLKPPQRDLLRGLGKRIAACPGTRLEVGGHTDSIGDDGRNFQLSWRRAEAVLAELKDSGVQAERTVVIGHGARVPFSAAPGAPDPNALNRRVELMVR
jgi:OOP family OmpA-OmpF porin